MVVGLTGFQSIKNKTILIVIHLFLPLTVLLTLFYLSIFPSTQLQFLSPLNYGNGFIKNWKSTIPLVGHNRNQSWSLGECEGRLVVALEVSNNKAIDSAITYTEKTISFITSINKNKPLAKNLTSNQKDKANYLLEQVKKIKEDTIKDEQNKGLLNHMTKYFTLVKFIWLVSIIGILYSIGPFLKFFFYEFIVKIIRIARMIWHRVLCHFWRPILYIQVIGIVSSICDVELSHDLRVYTTLLAAGLFDLAVFYTIFQLNKINALDLGAYCNKDEILFHYFILIGFLTFLPLAIITGSQLLGFITAMCLYSFLGFGVWSIYGGYLIGFHSEDQLLRCAGASTILLLLDMVSISTGIGSSIIKPFQSGLQSLGATAMYIALLIKSSKFNHESERISMLYIVSLFLGVVLGNVIPMIGLRNCAYVFIYLYFLDTITFYGNRLHFFVAMFLASLFLCIGCYVIHLNPSLLASLYYHV